MVNGDTVAVAKNRYVEVKAAFESYVRARSACLTGEEDGGEVKTEISVYLEP
jgi:hypothetical protein